MAQNMLIAKFPTMICHRPLPVTIYDITTTPEPRSEIMDASFAYSIVDDIQPVDLECALMEMGMSPKNQKKKVEEIHIRVFTSTSAMVSTSAYTSTSAYYNNYYQFAQNTEQTKMIEEERQKSSSPCYYEIDVIDEENFYNIV